MSDEMTTDSNNASFTNKEMWVRVDAKLDTIVGRQQGFDVELALVKERQHQHEIALAAHNQAEQEERKQVKADLDTARELMAQEVANIKEGQFSLNRALKYATGTVVAALLIVDGAIRFFTR